MGRKLWVVTRREYLERVRTRWFVISTLLAPVLFGVLMFLPLWLAKRAQPSADVARITILDATGTGLGRRVALELNGGISGDTSITRVVDVRPDALPAAESDAARAVMRRESKGYLVIDADAMSASRARYAGINATSQPDMRRLERVMASEILALKVEQAGVDPLTVRALRTSRFELDAERLTEKGRGGSGQVSTMFAFTVAFLLYISIFLYGQNVLRGVMEEKQTRVAEVVVSSVPATTLMAGKVVGVGAVGVTQLVLSTAAALALVRVRAPLLDALGLPQIPFTMPHVSLGVAALLFAFFISGYFFYAALFAAIGAMVNSEHEAQQVQLPVAMLLIVSAFFIQPVALAPEGTAARLLSVFPFSAAIIMPLRLSLVSVPAVDIAVSLVSLALWCYIAIWVAARIYRTGLLMYGKRPSLGEIVRWVRVAR